MHHTLSDSINGIIIATANLTRQQTTDWISQSGMSPDSVAQVLLEAAKLLFGSGNNEHALRLLWPLLEVANDTKPRQIIFGHMNTLVSNDEGKHELIVNTIQVYLNANDWPGLYEFLMEYGSEIDRRGLTNMCKAIITERVDKLTRARYNHNLELLKVSNTILYDKLIKKSNSDEFLVLPRTKDNERFFDVARFDGCKIAWVRGNDTPEQRAAKLSSILKRVRTKDGRPPVLSVLGIKSQLEIDKLMEFTSTTGTDNFLGMKRPLYIIEPNVPLFKAMMRLWHLDCLVGSGRVHFFIGSDAIKDLRAYLMADDQNLMPQMCIDLSRSPSLIPILDDIRVLAMEDESRLKETHAKARQYYRSISPMMWRDIYSCKQRPLRVMGITSRFSHFVQYCMRDLLDGFNRIGCDTMLMIERSDTKRLTDLYRNAELLRFKPDLIICINWNRNHIEIPREVPYVTWVQDEVDTIFDEDAASKVKKRDFIAVYARGWLPLLESLGYPEVFHFPMGVNPNIYKRVKLSDGDLRKYSCDVSFVGSLKKVPEDALDTFTQQLSPPIVQDVFRTMYALIEQAFVDGTGCYGKQYEEFLAKAEHNCGVQIKSIHRSSMIERFMLEVGYAMTRVFPIRWLIESGIDVHLYGNGWNKYPEFKRFARGFIKPGPELNKLYNASRITLTHHLGTGTPSLTNPLGSGAFCFANNIPKPYDLAPVDSDLDNNLVTFTGKTDFLNKIHYFLSNDIEREQIAETCRQIFVSRYDYSVMAQRLIDIVRERL